VAPEEVVAALAAWSVRLVQFNGMVAARIGVGLTELQCLYELARHGPATPGTLAARVNLTTGSASRMVERLHAAGHVHRVPDPADRRRVLIRPDPATLGRIGALYDPLNARLAAELEGVDDAALQHMATFLAVAERRTEDVIRELA
jgi:DNA-binding MarR family transcriptional regulator